MYTRWMFHIVVFVWGLMGKYGHRFGTHGVCTLAVYTRLPTELCEPAHYALKREPTGLAIILAGHYENLRPLFLLILQRLATVQVRSSVRLMPQNWPSGRGLLLSPTAWSPDQHPVAMLDDISRHILGRTEGCGLGFGHLVRTHKGKCLKCQSSSDGHSDHNALCAGGR